MLACSTLIYLGIGFFFLKKYQESLLISKMYEPALNFLLLTAALQLALSFLSCLYLYKKYLKKIDRPLSTIRDYLNELTRKEIPDTKLRMEETFANIKQVGLLIKVLVSFWRMEQKKQDSKIIRLQEKVKPKAKKSSKPQRAKSA